jgi:hypothetical protein
MWKI